MKYAIVYQSRTGNTGMLANTLRDLLPQDSLVCFGEPCPQALEADLLFVGFWTDKGSCDEKTGAFLKTLTDQKIFLFGTAGFGGSQDYYDKILAKVRKLLPAGVTVTGAYLCQGKMPQSVRERYEKLLKAHAPIPNLKGMLENFDHALTHPDTADLEALSAAVRSQL